jgi:hypothetical protein
VSDKNGEHTIVQRWVDFVVNEGEGGSPPTAMCYELATNSYELAARMVFVMAVVLVAAGRKYDNCPGSLSTTRRTTPFVGFDCFLWHGGDVDL